MAGQSSDIANKPVPEPDGTNFKKLTQGQVADAAQALQKSGTLPDLVGWGPNSLRTLRMYYDSSDAREHSKGGFGGADGVREAFATRREIDGQIDAKTQQASAQLSPQQRQGTYQFRPDRFADVVPYSPGEPAAPPLLRTPVLAHPVTPSSQHESIGRFSQSPVATITHPERVTAAHEPEVKKWGDRHEPAIAVDAVIHEKFPIQGAGFYEQVKGQQVLDAAAALTKGSRPDISKFGADATEALYRQLRFDLNDSPLTPETLASVNVVTQHQDAVSAAAKNALDQQAKAAANPAAAGNVPVASGLTLDKCKQDLTIHGLEPYIPEALRSLDQMASDPKHAGDKQAINQMIENFVKTRPAEADQYGTLTGDILSKTAPLAPAAVQTPAPATSASPSASQATKPPDLHSYHNDSLALEANEDRQSKSDPKFAQKQALLEKYNIDIRPAKSDGGAYNEGHYEVQKDGGYTVTVQGSRLTRTSDKNENVVDRALQAIDDKLSDTPNAELTPRDQKLLQEIEKVMTPAGVQAPENQSTGPQASVDRHGGTFVAGGNITSDIALTATYNASAQGVTTPIPDTAPTFTQQPAQRPKVGALNA